MESEGSTAPLPKQILLARTMHRFLSRSDESDDLARRVTRKRVPRGPRKRTLEYVEEADRVERKQDG